MDYFTRWLSANLQFEMFSEEVQELVLALLQDSVVRSPASFRTT